MYSQTLWAHARNPKNRGRLEEASAVGKSRYAKCGDDFTLYLLIDAELRYDVLDRPIEQKNPLNQISSIAHDP